MRGGALLVCRLTNARRNKERRTENFNVGYNNRDFWSLKKKHTSDETAACQEAVSWTQGGEGEGGGGYTLLALNHRAQRSSMGRFPLCNLRTPSALYSNLRRSALYIDLHDGYRRTTTSQARESWSVLYIMLTILSYLCPRAPAMWCYRSAVSFIYTLLALNHRAQRSSMGRFPLCNLRTPSALYSNLRRSALYIDLHDGYRRTTTSQARESWSVLYIMLTILSYLCPRAPAMWCYRSAVSFMYSCVRHVSQYIGFT